MTTAASVSVSTAEARQGGMKILRAKNAEIGLNASHMVTPFSSLLRVLGFPALVQILLFPLPSFCCSPVKLGQSISDRDKLETRCHHCAYLYKLQQILRQELI